MRSFFSVTVLDSEHFVGHVQVDESDSEPNVYDLIEVYLFRLDVARMECTVVDKHKFNGTQEHIIADNSDPRKFLFCYQNSHTYDCYAQKGILNNGKLEIDNEILDFEFKIPGKNLSLHGESVRISGNKLCIDHYNFEFRWQIVWIVRK
jgi:hypothetical protein